MIKANELRIGNWVQGTFKKYKICQITNSVCGLYTLTQSDGFALIWKEVKPIPLTEEWAIKFGYECLVEMACGFAGDSKFRIEISSMDLLKMNVHEAQNLYFALTNTELTIKST